MITNLRKIANLIEAGQKRRTDAQEETK